MHSYARARLQQVLPSRKTPVARLHHALAFWTGTFHGADHAYVLAQESERVKDRKRPDSNCPTRNDLPAVVGRPFAKNLRGRAILSAEAFIGRAVCPGFGARGERL